MGSRKPVYTVEMEAGRKFVSVFISWTTYIVEREDDIGCYPGE